jgi:3-oxoacyl-[acyl-carrier protein] reductase
MEFEGQIALVTGGGQGIGKAISLALAKDGADVVIFDLNLEKAEEVSKEIEGLGRRSLILRIDVVKPEEVEDGFRKAIEALGRLDILVNNAGITKDALLIRMKDEDWDKVLDVNLKGTFLCTRAAVKTMSKQRYGRIISISSVVAFMGNPGQVNYVASKAAIVGFTKTVAKEYATRGITVNAIAPGFIRTAMTEALPEQVKEAMLKEIPIGRFGDPDDVANAVKFLASKDSAYITGQVIHVNGGMYM